MGQPDIVALIVQSCIFPIRGGSAALPCARAAGELHAEGHRLNLLLDLLPLVVFYAVFRIAKSMPDATVAFVATWIGTVNAGPDLRIEMSAVIVATACAIVAALIQIGWLLARRRTVKPTVWISAALIVIFGGLTVWLRNEWFIKWKPSVLYWIFAALLLGGKLLWDRNLLGMLLSKELVLPARIWDRLLYAWAAFFALLGAANLLVAYGASTDTWVNFKTFGLLGLTLAFSIGTGLYMARYLAPDGQARASTRGPDG